jgi:ABC-type antimicrobial peptide transport system permease subunit
MAWLIAKGLKGRGLYIGRVAFVTAVAVTEFSILMLLTAGAIRLIVLSSTSVLSVLAVSGVIRNGVQQRAYRVAVLTAFGAKRWPITILLLTESAVGSLLGSFIGGIPAFFLNVPSTDHKLQPLLPISLGFVIGMIACTFYIRKIMELSISERF